MNRPSSNSDSPSRGKRAESLLAAIFERAGWRVRHSPRDAGADLVLRRKSVEYVVEVKAAPEGRADRLVPLFAQAVLEAKHAAGSKGIPLAVVAAPKVSLRAADEVLKFASDYAPDLAAGVIDFEGLARFRGPQLEELNALAPEPVRAAPQHVRDSGDLFSDLNQWMLKVLLAPEIPDSLLSAPRGRYRNASELARAANVSVMSAFRFVEQLRHEGYLHESAPHLDLVRRASLFERWRAPSGRSPREAAMRFVLAGDPKEQLRKVLHSRHGCLALFAAAEALLLGFVSGVPPYVYVERLQPSSLGAWMNLRPCRLGESPALILRQAPAPQSVFRGAVNPEGVQSCDVLQVWLDVASHPSRGKEQADLIEKRVLNRVVGNPSGRG